jgi:hypothetical protein
LNLRSWLRRKPDASTFKVGEHEIKIPDGRSKWAELEATIAAKVKRGDLVEAFDEDGATLRAFTWSDGEAVADEAAAAKPMNEHQQLVLLAGLLERASDRGAERHAEAYRESFSTMVNLVNLVSNRLVAMETAWMSALQETAKARAEAIEASADKGGIMDQVVPMVLEMGMEKMRGKTAEKTNGTPPPNGKANGKAKES